MFALVVEALFGGLVWYWNPGAALVDAGAGDRDEDGI